MNHIEPGVYKVFYTDFSGGPGKVLLRPLGFDEHKALVILRENDDAPKWIVIPEPGHDGAQLFVKHLCAIPIDESKVLGVPGGHHPWFILKSAPHPPPMGNNAYAIFISRGDMRAWNAPKDMSDDPAAVVLEPIGFPFFFQRVEDDDN